jgi:hypothetical protein
MQLNGRGEQRKVGRDSKPRVLGLPEGWRSLGNQDVRHKTPVDFRLPQATDGEWTARTDLWWLRKPKSRGIIAERGKVALRGPFC